MKKLLVLLLVLVTVFSLAACDLGNDNPGNADNPGGEENNTKTYA